MFACLQDQVKDILIKGCDFVPGDSLKSKCRNFVTEKGVGIIKNIMENVSPNNVCSVLCLATE